MLDRPGVLAVIGKLVTAGMAEHVAVDQEREACSLTGPRDHPLIASNAQRRLPFGHEDMDAFEAVRHFSLQFAQCPHFPAANGVNAGHSALAATDVQLAGSEIYVVPTEFDQL